MKKSIAILIVMVMAGTVQAAFNDAVNALNPVGYWQFEDDWTDETAGGNTLTPFGSSAAFTDGPGLPGLSGRAADFRHEGGQSGASVATGGGNVLNLSGSAYTINAWVSNRDFFTGQNRSFIAVERDANWNASAGANYGLSTFRDNTGLTNMRSWTQGSLANATDIAGVDDGWHMMTVSATLGGTANFYIDGALVGSGSVGGSSLAGDGAFLSVGNNCDGSGCPGNDLDGRIDELAVFDTALTGPQIQGLYDAAIPEPATLGLLGLGSLAFLRRRR